MSSGFTFKQFHIDHDRCAMKVGTDSILLGAWVNDLPSTRILDIGSGSGVMSLMLAQRSKAQIIGVEIEKPAYEQSVENAQNSPWSNRVKFVNADLKEFSRDTFDCIISNPPYFPAGQRFDPKRMTARHTGELSFEELLDKVIQLLTPQGMFSCILPFEQGECFKELAAAKRLFLKRHCDVFTQSSETSPKRVLLSFGFCQSPCEHSTVVIRDGEDYTTEFKYLTRDFYLKH